MTAGANEASGESAYLLEFSAVTESLETEMRQCVSGQAAAPRAATPAPSS
jgi:hypothetical protein